MTIKKLLLLLLIVPLVFAIQSCGKGAGEGYTPPGSGPGDPVYVKLKPARYAAQTNGCIDFYAEVHDAQGELLANIPVTFTNLSEPLGVILDRCGGIEIHTPVTTDSWGRAKITIMSTTPGFVTVLAQTTLGAQPRDRKTVLFSFCDTYDCLVLAPSLHLDVISVPGDGIYNKPSDFIIFEPPPDPDNTVDLLATVRDPYGVLIPDTAVTWGSDHAEAMYTRTEPFTNVNGQAVGIVLVTPMSLRDTDTHVTVWALAPNVGYTGAYNVVTLFLRPIFISNISVTANPSIVAPEGISSVTATLTLNTGLGDPVPDGVTVIFTTCDAATCTMPCGIIDPFAQTIGGRATVSFTAPPLPDTCRVTARVNTTTGFTDILVTTALTVQPESLDLDGAIGGTATYTITGGVSPYTVTADTVDPNLQPVPASVVNSGDTFDVVVPAGTPDTTVTYTITDAVGETVEATLNIIEEPLIIIPGSVSTPAGTGGPVDFIITGGIPPYIVTSTDSAAVYDTAPGDGQWNVAASGDTFTATASATVCPTTVTLDVYDSVGTTTSATVDITASTLLLAPATATICETTNNCYGLGFANNQNYTITGGIPPYATISSNAAVVPHPGAAAAFNVVAVGAIAADTTIALTTTDACSATSTADLLILR